MPWPQVPSFPAILFLLIQWAKRGLDGPDGLVFTSLPFVKTLALFYLGVHFVSHLTFPHSYFLLIVFILSWCCFESQIIFAILHYENKNQTEELLNFNSGNQDLFNFTYQIPLRCLQPRYIVCFASELCSRNYWKEKIENLRKGFSCYLHFS